MKLVSNAALWQELSKELSEPEQDIQKRLNVIVDRRNKIAHEADVNPLFPHERWPIDEKLVNDSVDYIERLAGSIHKIVVQVYPIPTKGANKIP